MTDAPDASGSDETREAPPEPEPVEGLRLAAPDDHHDREEWEAAAAAVLRKGRQLGEEDGDEEVWSRLAQTTLDGISVTPLGTPELMGGLVTAGRPARTGPWDVRTQVEVVDVRTANEAILQDLDNGATSLLLHLEGHASPDWDALLDGVLLNLAPVALDRPSSEQVEGFAAFLEASGGDIHPATNLSFDLQTDQMLASRVRDDGQEPGDLLASLARRAADVGVRGLVVDGTALHDAGASDAQELGWVIATGLAYLRLLADAGFSVHEAAPLLEFRLAATDEQFPTIAKLRAARRMWARVLEASGGNGEMALHAVTSRPMSTRRDPWVNILRGTVAAFAAGVGGADAVTVVPFDERLGLPDSLGRRIARNTSSLLVEESHVAAVSDPAGGAYAVEKLTDDLAVAGWAELGRIEEDGGALTNAARENVRARVRGVVAARDAQVADRSRPITGLSEFPNLAEKLPERERAPHRFVHQYGHAYEDMRAEPATQPVFLATLGKISSHTARASFATNLLAAGGVAVEAAGATKDVEDLVTAYRGQRVVVLAGSDPAYAEWGADAARALRDAGATYVVLAGKPGERTVAAHLVDDSCAMGVDALAFLTRIREEIAR